MTDKAMAISRIRDQLLTCIDTLGSATFMLGGSNSDAVKIAIEHLNRAVGEIDAHIEKMER